MNRSALRQVAGIFVALLLVAGGGGAFIWWKISGLKEQLVRDLSGKLGAHVEIASLDLDPWKGELRAAGISLTNERASAPWDKGEISQATIHFHLSDLLSSTLPLNVEVSSWSLTLHSYASAVSPSETPSTAALPGPIGTVPDTNSAGNRVQVTEISAEEGSVEIDLSEGRKVLVHGVSFEAGNNGAGVWTTQLQATSVESGSMTAAASSVQIRGEQDKITFSNLRMACSQGFITGDGEASLSGEHATQATLKATDLPVTMLVAVQWQMKLSGLVTGDLTYQGDDHTGSAKGQIALSHAKFNILPWLGKLTSFVSLPDITDVEVDKATTDFEWADHTLHLTNLDVRKNDVTRIAGTVDVDPTGQIDGKLKLGLPSTVTSKWPQLQDKLFSVQFEDYNWAEVHLTGTPDHLQEDLTPRLLDVGLQEGGGILNQATQKASDLLKNIMGN